ncbi:MAG: hypothetical protein M3416_00140 [Acidobacteriota bacterium]|nr:hypothetical protein [Acidobacteriota bacterium]
MEMSSRKEAEDKLRQRIRRMLVEAGANRMEPSVVRKAEDQALQLLDDFVKAPEGAEDEVYKRGEQRILRTFQEAFD